MTVTEPLYGTVTEELYDWLRPLAYADPSYDYPLKRLCAVLGEQLQPVDDVVRGDDTRPGWSVIWNVDDCPDWALDALAQVVGTQLDVGITADQKRTEIRDHLNFLRGTPDAIARAARRSLVPRAGYTEAYVLIQERYGGDPYHFRVITFDVETPNAPQVVADVTAAKPIGLTFDHVVVPAGKVWDTAAGHWDDTAATTTQWDQADTSSV